MQKFRIGSNFVKIHFDISCQELITWFKGTDSNMAYLWYAKKILGKVYFCSFLDSNLWKSYHKPIVKKLTFWNSWSFFVIELHTKEKRIQFLAITYHFVIFVVFLHQKMIYHIFWMPLPILLTPYWEINNHLYLMIFCFMNL